MHPDSVCKMRVSPFWFVILWMVCLPPLLPAGIEWALISQVDITIGFGSEDASRTAAARLLKTATEKAQQNDLAGAIAAARKAVKTDPKWAVAYEQLGVYLEAKKDVTSACAAFKKSVQLDPQRRARSDELLSLLPVGNLLNGFVKAAQEDYSGAATAYGAYIKIVADHYSVRECEAESWYAAHEWNKTISSFGRVVELSPDLDAEVYVPLYCWGLRARLGLDNKDLNSLLAQRLEDSPDKWASKIAGFLVGKISQVRLLESASTAKDEETKKGQLCEAWYYSGMKRLISGDKKGAVESFQKCLATNQTDFQEYFFAKTELALLRY